MGYFGRDGGGDWENGSAGLTKSPIPFLTPTETPGTPPPLQGREAGGEGPPKGGLRVGVIRLESTEVANPLTERSNGQQELTLELGQETVGTLRPDTHVLAE